jgi:hypothetical protein
MRTDSDIDRLLKQAGERWRSSVPVDSAIDIGRISIRPQGLWSRIGPAASLTALAAVLALAFLVGRPFSSVPLGGAESTPTTSGGEANPLGALVVRPGDEVTATGKLLASSQGTLYLCPTGHAATLTQGGVPSEPGCIGAPLVLVRGADGDTWDAKYAILHGSWDGEALQATLVTAAPAPGAQVPPPVPCPTPAAGWPGNASAGAGESAATTLGREIQERPETYVGSWVAAIAGEFTDPIASRVVVVGTVEDPTAITTRLEKIYPYNLCVIHVAYSAHDLQPVLGQISAVGRDWLARIEPAVDRVVVTTTALDALGAEALAPYGDLVEVRAAILPAN